MDIFKEVINAKQRIEAYILKTPLLYSQYLSDLTGGEVYLKMESEQFTGSFKARGAFSKITWLIRQGENKPVITASTGNHGLGVARALKLLKWEGRIVIPENTVSGKVEGLQACGADLERHGADCFESELYAKEIAERDGRIYISPYNDPQVIGGQGTTAMEIAEQFPRQIHNVFVTVGGGGLISGIGTYLKTVHPEVNVFGCQPENSPEMALSVGRNAYTIVESKETLSDASAGAFEEDSITYDICKNVVDEFFLVKEPKIGETIRIILAKERKLIEGAAAVAVAPLLENPGRWKNQNSVVVICGGNISIDKLQKVLCEEN
jgi:threonine dehydratase